MFPFRQTADASGNGCRKGAYKDLFIYRGALNADEVAALGHGQMLHASLDIYSPLSAPAFATGSMVENLAQSLDALKVGSDRVSHADEGPTTK